MFFGYFSYFYRMTTTTSLKKKCFIYWLPVTNVHYYAAHFHCMPGWSRTVFFFEIKSVISCKKSRWLPTDMATDIYTRNKVLLLRLCRLWLHLIILLLHLMTIWQAVDNYSSTLYKFNIAQFLVSKCHLSPWHSLSLRLSN